MKSSIDKVDLLYFSRTLKDGPVIIETLKSMLKKSNIPDTFLYMAMVESKFLTTAKSSKKAAGLWQLMPQTAKNLKLTINSKIDERLDPIKSTKVAIKYLQYLHGRFHKWYLVAMAYNCGETRLSKAITKAGTDNIFALLDSDYNYLPKETRRYIRKLIVASLIAHSDAMLSEAKKIQTKHKKIKLKTLKVKEGTSLKKVASSYKIPVRILKKYNAHILKGVTPKGHRKYCIYIPEDKINKEKAICSINENIFTYTVKEGDTLFLISKRFNNKMSAIKKLNQDLPKTLTIGKKLALIGKNNEKLKYKSISFTAIKKPAPLTQKSPVEKTTTLTILPKQKKDKIVLKEKPLKNKQKAVVKDNNKRKITKIVKLKPTKNNEKTFSYTVQNGDTLFSVSKKFNNKVSTLIKLNGKLSSKLKVGRTLTIKR